VKQSHCRAEQARRCSRSLRLPDFKTIGTWRWQYLQPYAQAAFTPHKIFLVLIFLTDWVDPRAVMRPERLCHWKIPMTPSGIEPASFQLVAQCLKHVPHRLLLHIIAIYIYETIISSSSSCSWRVWHASCSLILKMKLVPPTLLRLIIYVPNRRRRI